MVMIGCARHAWHLDQEVGLLAQFRHQYFLVALIAHFQKAALLQMSNRLVSAVSALEKRDAMSMRVFKAEIRDCLQAFLRFNHRYWCYEVSSQSMVQDLYAMFGRHLGNTESFNEVRQEILDMGQYLDSDDARRQGESVLRLTVVTILGLVGTIVTGFLGMNLIAEADQPMPIKILYFFIVLVPTIILTLFTVHKSSVLSGFIDTIGDVNTSWRGRMAALKRVRASFAGAKYSSGEHL